MGRPNRLGAPEGMRVDNLLRRRMRAGSLAALVLLCACFAIAIGDETVSLTVSNLTPHVVTVVVADRTFPRIAPGADATYRASGAATVTAKVSYAPGEGIEGSAQRSFLLSPYHPSVNSGTTVYFACTTGNAIVAPASGGPMQWKVTADTLAHP